VEGIETKRKKTEKKRGGRKDNMTEGERKVGEEENKIEKK
jgi:hypothetical protein